MWGLLALGDAGGECWNRDDWNDLIFEAWLQLSKMLLAVTIGAYEDQIVPSQCSFLEMPRIDTEA